MIVFFAGFKRDLFNGAIFFVGMATDLLSPTLWDMGGVKCPSQSLFLNNSERLETHFKHVFLKV